MTHTLHRTGDTESLCQDYIILVMPARFINLDGSEDKMIRIWEIAEKYGDRLSNFGNLTDGNSHKIDIEGLKKGDNRISHIVFKDRGTLKACLQDIKEAELGISVVVSGLYDQVVEVCNEVGLKPHTVEHSLGVHGKTELLPSDSVMELTTMCGHAMVSANLVDSLVEDIKGERIAFKEAAVEMSKLCECGVFNPDRAENLLKKMV